MKHDSDILKRIKHYFMRRKSAEEAHAFEREIEKDGFLYEAIEGLEDILSSDLQQALDELDDRLDERVKERPLYLKWQLAASIAVLLAFGAGIYALLQRNHQPTDESNFSYQTEGFKSQSDSTIYQPREEAITFIPLEEITTERSDTQAMSSFNTAGATGITNQVDPRSAKDATVIDPALALAEKEPVNEKRGITASEKVQATIEAEPETGNTAFLDAETQSGTRYNAQTTERSLAMPSTASAPSSEQDFNSSMEETTKKDVVNNTATPIGGRVAYDAYIRRSVRRTPGMPEGSVLLQFEFDKDGRPKKIEVVKSLCTACDLEAKRVISEGPTWQVTDKKEVVTVSVPFD